MNVLEGMRGRKKAFDISPAKILLDLALKCIKSSMR